MMEQATEVLSVGEVAKLLQVSSRTVERLPIRYAKVGRARRYLREHVLDYLRKKAS